MNKFRLKTLISIGLIVSVVLTCTIMGLAAASSTTYVVWNAKETQASAVTDGNAPIGYTYYVVADITSNSTGMHSFSYNNAYNGGSATATAGPVNVTYPSPIPLVDYYGGHEAGLYPGY